MTAAIIILRIPFSGSNVEEEPTTIFWSFPPQRRYILISLCGIVE
jgi:hypothetical protein